MPDLGDLPTARLETWRRVVDHEGESYEYDAAVEVLAPMPPLTGETVLIAYPALAQLLEISGFERVDPPAPESPGDAGLEEVFPDDGS